MSQEVTVGVVVGSITFLVILFSFFFWLRIRLEDNDVIRQIAGGKKPVRFSHRQLVRYTDNYSARLGSGALGRVYAGTLPNGLKVAVKTLHAGVDWRSEAEFIADVVGTIWRCRHTNLVRLVGYCFDTSTDNVVAFGAATLRAMVFEYMERGALDAFLVDCGRGRDQDAGSLPDLNLLHSLALGVARGIQYLHDGCQHKIVHYGIKPRNVLLDRGLTPKVADFGLAQLMRRGCRDDAHAAMSMQPPGLADKFDVYSFGMLVLQILDLALAGGRNLDEAESKQQWFPRVTWTKYESGNLMDLVVDDTPAGNDDGHAVVVAAGDDDDLQQRTETVERMCKVAFWCMQRQPDARPPMGLVVKMLEGDMDITPPPNPFKDLMWGDTDTHGDPGIIPFDKSAAHGGEQVSQFQAWTMAHKGKVTSDVSYNPDDPPEAYNNPSAHTCLTEYTSMARVVHGPEYDPTTQELDGEVIVRVGGGKKHGRYWIGDGTLDTATTPTLTQIGARSTSGSPAIRPRPDTTHHLVVLLQAQLVEEKRLREEAEATARQSLAAMYQYIQTLGHAMGQPPPLAIFTPSPPPDDPAVTSNQSATSNDLVHGTPPSQWDRWSSCQQ